jgi:hypothetical protein
MSKKNIFHAKTKLVDILDGEELIVIINEQEAWEYWINEFDKVVILYDNKKLS